MNSSNTKENVFTLKYLTFNIQLRKSWCDQTLNIMLRPSLAGSEINNTFSKHTLPYSNPHPSLVTPYCTFISVVCDDHG